MFKDSFLRHSLGPTTFLPDDGAILKSEVEEEILAQLLAKPEPQKYWSLPPEAKSSDLWVNDSEFGYNFTKRTNLNPFAVTNVGTFPKISSKFDWLI